MCREVLTRSVLKALQERELFPLPVHCTTMTLHRGGEFSVLVQPDLQLLLEYICLTVFSFTRGLSVQFGVSICHSLALHTMQPKDFVMHLQSSMYRL